MDPSQADFVLRVLSVVASAELHDAIYWRTDSEYAPVTFFVNCNDLFYWACADSETITPGNLPVLEQAIADCKAAEPAGGVFYAFDLFCATVRRMRPQGCCYPEAESLWPLFNAAGPGREVGIGNPYTPERYRDKKTAERKAKAE